MDITQLAPRLLDLLRGATHITLLPHNNPDADSLGSALAFAQFLKHHNIPHSLVTLGPVAPYLHTLPFFHTTTTTVTPHTSHLITFDAADARHAQLPLVLSLLSTTPHITVIDHHATNTNFGDYNIVIPHYPSTTALITDIFRATNTPISPTTATLLLSGLQTDTGNFTNPATSPRAFSTASHLVACGAVPSTTWEHIKRNKSPQLLSLFGFLLQRIAPHPTLPLFVTYITHQELQTLHCTDTDVGNFPDYLLSTASLPSMLLLHERADGAIKGSFRTTRDDFDVSALAQQFGGGGHTKAAGFIGTKKLSEYLT